MPKGIKKATINGVTDVWPSWYTQKSSGISNEKMTFDKISKKLATECTPEETKVQVNVMKSTDPITKKETISADGYDPENEDNVHSCSDARPSIETGTIAVSGGYNDPEDPDAGGTWTVQFSAGSGTYKLKSASITAGGASYTCSSIGMCTLAVNPHGGTIKVTDVAGYVVTATIP